VENTTSLTDAAVPAVEGPVHDDLLVLPASIRPYQPIHEAAVRRIFRSTVALGAPLKFAYRDLARYEKLALDWYLDPANHRARRADAVVVVDNGFVRGYLLACLDQHHHDAWIRRAAIRWGMRALVRLPLQSRDARRFVRLRVRDGLESARRPAPLPYPAHMHFNLDPGLRGALLGHHLVGWMDARVRAAGLAGYMGEINVPEGRSLRALEAAGARVIHRTPSHTFSWIAGRPVDRCLVAREVGPDTDALAVVADRTAAPADAEGTP
jgi:hypothetical protein